MKKGSIKYHKDCKGILHSNYTWNPSWSCSICKKTYDENNIKQQISHKEKILPKWPLRVKRLRETWKATKISKLRKGWLVMYSKGYGRSFGRLEIPDGWQDMDRTWTSQDIFWVDKVDCKLVLGRA